MSGCQESLGPEIRPRNTPRLRTLELAQCCTGFEKKAAFSEISRRDRENLTASETTLLADAKFPNDNLVALGIVSLEVVEQATPLADQHKQAAARAVVLLVRLEVIRQLANAFTDDGDLNLGTPRVSRVRLILVNDRFLLLSG